MSAVEIDLIRFTSGPLMGPVAILADKDGYLSIFDIDGKLILEMETRDNPIEANWEFQDINGYASELARVADYYRKAGQRVTIGQYAPSEREHEQGEVGEAGGGDGLDHFPPSDEAK